MSAAAPARPPPLPSLIQTVRDGVGWLNLVGHSPDLWRLLMTQLAQTVHHWAHPNDSTTPFSEPRVPFSVLFNSSEDMLDVLEFMGQGQEREGFKNLYLSSKFPLCLADEVSPPLTSHPRVQLAMMRNRTGIPEAFDMLCNPAKVKDCFVGVGVDPAQLDLCSFTSTNLAIAYMMKESSFAADDLLFRLLKVGAEVTA